MIRAWHVHNGDPYESSLLIFAATRGRAKVLAQRADLWEYETFTEIVAVRAPKFDFFFLDERVIETNADLPDDAPRFYSEGDSDEV